MTKTKLPESIRASVEVYVISPSSGADTMVRCVAIEEMPDKGFEPIIEAACTVLNSMMGVDDARPMTRSEVVQHRRQNLDRARANDNEEEHMPLIERDAARQLAEARAVLKRFVDAEDEGLEDDDLIRFGREARALLSGETTRRRHDDH